MIKKARLIPIVIVMIASMTLALPPGLYALFKTSMGDITCELYPDKAPQTVANFVNLATGLQPWMDPVTATINHTPLYNATILHRIIPNFMIQGGDPTGTGRGGPGYRFNDEFNAELRHDKPGRLSMANSGPNTNGSQFFITVVATPWLDNHHSIFGQVVEGMKVVNAIVVSPRDGADKPLKNIVIDKVVISDTRPSKNYGAH